MRRFPASNAFAALLLSLTAIGISGCGGSDPLPATGAKVTQPYDVRGDAGSPPGQPEQAPFRLATATEAVPAGASAPREPKLAIEPYERWSMSETAAQALGRIGPAAVPDLVRALADPNPVIRKRAADVLARIGPAAKDAVPALTQALDDRDDEVRKSAVRALGEIGPDAQEAVPHLIEALREPGRITSDVAP